MPPAAIRARAAPSAKSGLGSNLSDFEIHSCAMMPAAIVYVSVHHGNTRRIAAAMAEPLGASLLSVEEAMSLDGQSLDLVGFGSGIYFGRHHASLFELVRKLKSMPRRCFVYSTAGISWLSSVWHRSLVQQIRGRGSEVIGQFNSPGWDTVGPLWLLGGAPVGTPDPSSKMLKRC